MLSDDSIENIDTLKSILLDCQCAIFLFDITNTKSFDKIEKLFKELDCHKFPCLKIILVENKIDENREINDEIINNFMEKNDIEKKFQISIKNGIGIEKLAIEIKNCLSNLDKSIPNNFCCQLLNNDNNEMKYSNYKGILNIIFLGNSMVGKSCLFLRLNKNSFREDFLSSIGVDKVPKSFKYKNDKYKINLYDTAGQDRYRSTLPSKYYKNSDGVFLLFDLGNKESFNDISIWMSEINAKHGNSSGNKNGPVIFLVGNKLDIEEREVSFDEAENKANFYGIKYFEISCKFNLNIPEMYARMITQCIPNIINNPIQNSFQINTVRVKKKKNDNKICC